MNDTLDKELKEIEAQLANLSPIEMPDDMIYRMEQAMFSWADHADEEKIVPFNKMDDSSPAHSAVNTPIQTKSRMNAWGAAAAIALMAGVSAVFMTGENQTNPVTAGTPNVAPKKLSSMVPIEDRATTKNQPELSRNITHASNEGITFAGKDEAPFKVLRIEYTEKIVTEDKDGNAVVTKKPCVEHILVPVPVH